MKRLFVIALLSFMMTACAKSDEKAVATTIAFTQSEFVFNVYYNSDGTVDADRIAARPLAQFVKISPKASREKTLLWKSSDNEVASVDAEGMVTPLKEGETTITVSVDDASGSCLIRCVKCIDLKSISFLPPAEMENGRPVLRIFQGDKIYLPIKIEPAEVTEEYVRKWSSDNNEVATVDEDGYVTAVGPGETFVTVTLTKAGDDGSEEMHAESCKVIVAEQRTFELCYQASSTFTRGTYRDAWSFENHDGYLYACADGKDIYHVSSEKINGKYTWIVYKNGEELYRVSETGEITAFCARQGHVAIAIQSTLITINPDRTVQRQPIVVVDENKQWNGVISTSHNRLSIALDGTVYALVRIDDGSGSVAAMTRYATDGTVSSYRVPYNISASSLIMDENDSVFVFVHDLQKQLLNTYGFDGKTLSITGSMKLAGNVSSLSCCRRNGSVYIMCLSGFTGRTGKIFRDYELLYETSPDYKYRGTAIEVSADGDIFYCFDRKIFRYADDGPIQISSVDGDISYFALNYID